MEIKTQKKLDYLADTKAAIKAALIEQGQEVSDADTFRSYADKVLAIAPVLQEKTATPGTAGIEVLPDEGYSGLSKVTVEGDANLLPENILSGVDIFGVTGTAESGGSGGGSLPAGVYLQAVGIPTPENFDQAWFVYNGELYAAANYSSTGAGVWRIYKWGGSSWTTVVSTFDTGLAAPRAHSFIELNGKIHICGYEQPEHVVFDGATLAKMSDLPAKVTNFGLTAYNGKLYAGTYNNGDIYEWDEDSDTWSVFYSTGNKYANSLTPFVVGNDLYYQLAQKVYRFVGGTPELVATLTGGSLGAVAGGRLYSYNQKSNKYTTWYEYNLAENKEALCGVGPWMSSVMIGILNVYNDEVHLFLGYHGTCATNYKIVFIPETE